MNRGLGYLQDPPKAIGEAPDWDFAAVTDRYAAASVPARADLDALVIDVLDQGRLSSCVANAIQQAIRMRHVAQGVANPVLGSRLQGYYLARAVDALQAIDAGAHLRTYMECLNRFGFCPEALWPYDDNPEPGARFTKMPSTKAFHAAFDLRSPTTYRRITSSGDAKLAQFRHAIAASSPVVFGVDVDAAFCGWDFDAARPLGPPSGDIVGGHAMLVLGYDGDTFKVLNSWGPDFGLYGRFWMTPEYAAQTRDCWVVEHAPIEGEK